MKIKLYRYPLLIIAILLIALLSGCQPIAKDRYTPVILSPQLAHSEILGYSVQNRPIELITLGNGPDTVLIIATIHGDEDAGTPLVYHLIEKIKATQSLLEGRTVLIMPLANPDGFTLRTRYNASKVDLNRNFPAENRINNKINGPRGLSEPESVILHNLILIHQPARIVTIHQPLYCLDFDGPADDLALSMSQYCPLPVKKLGSRPGSLGSFAGVEQKIPIVTMELAESDSQLPTTELWSKYGYALLAAITYPQPPHVPSFQ